MAEPTATPAPAAAPSPASVPSPSAAPVAEVNVSDLKPSSSIAPPKPGSARERMNRELRKKGTLGVPQAPEKPEAPEPSTATPDPEKPEGGDVEAPAGAAPAAPDPKTGKPAKVNPWKLVDEYKAKNAKLEADLVESGKRGIPKDQWEQAQAKSAAIEKRNKELEDHIRYVDYTKSQEFKDKYQQPYEQSWSRAMKDLKEVTIEDGEGGGRLMNSEDLLNLVNLPLQKARAEAERLYGPLANDIMNHRNEIRRLFDEQSEALEKAKTDGSVREKERSERMQRERGELTTGIRETWSKTNDAITKDEKYGKFFVPVEGDEQGNQRLAKGFGLADRAFSENPLTPGLTPEQRRGIVERHAAVRNRAAAFGRLVYQNEQQAAELKSLKKELEEFKGTVPGTSGSSSAAASATEAKGFSRIRASLQKIAK